jgi:hypothetical protein
MVPNLPAVQPPKLRLFEQAGVLVTGTAGASFDARAAVLAPVGAAAALFGARVAASIERPTAPADDEVAAAPAKTEVVHVGEFAVLTLGGRRAVTSEAKAAPIERPSA